MPASGKISSPLTTLIPFITAEEASSLAYPPDALPGARDVGSTYGVMRVYEWGPLDGKKVLFVHGDSTPSVVFSKIAQALVDVGHRVMLFDLWGRGYSDTPLDCRHDVRLFESQLLLALMSSPISWTGDDNSFSIIAFSLGGPISLAFVGDFPAAVKSLVLLGPAGLLRKLPSGYEQHLHQPQHATSQQSLRESVRQIFGVAPFGPTLNIQPSRKREVATGRGPSRVEKSFDMEKVLQWQFDHHRGQVTSFLDTIRYGPLWKEQEIWGKVCDIVAGRTRPDTALHGSKLLVIFGEDDDLVVGKEVTEDILKLLPPDHLQVEYVPGGHGIPYANSETVTSIILEFWR